MVMRIATVLAPLIFAGACATSKVGTQTRAASYSVPVADNLKKFSKFELNEVTIQRDGDELVIKYVLPLELTGKPQPIQFSGKVPPTGPLILTGTNGKMTCKSSTDLSNCEVAYKDIDFDQATRLEVLKARAKTPDELAQREAVAVAFYSGGEPHGILHIYNYDPSRAQGYKPR